MRTWTQVTDLSTEVRSLAERYGWLTLTAQDNWLILTNGVTLLFAVVLAHGESLSPEQALWCAALLHTEKVERYVWRPDDLAHIAHLLDRETR